eukprot:543315-Alexandrium_andersonii.AAC.1
MNLHIPYCKACVHAECRPWASGAPGWQTWPWNVLWCAVGSTQVVGLALERAMVCLRIARVPPNA